MSINSPTRNCSDDKLTRFWHSHFLCFLPQRTILSMSNSHTSQHWTHLPWCEFIQLAMIGSGELRRGDREEEMVRLAQLGRIEIILDRTYNTYCQSWQTLSNTTTSCATISSSSLKSSSHMPQMGTVRFLLGKFVLAYLPISILMFFLPTNLFQRLEIVSPMFICLERRALIGSLHKTIRLSSLGWVETCWHL